MSTRSAEKPAILFIGSFKPMAADGTVGGQMFACRSLVESPLRNLVEWRLLDSTMLSLPPPGFVRRASRAAGRLGRAILQLMRPSTSVLLVFCSFNGPSLLEKGIVCLFARLCGKRVVLGLRSEVPAAGARAFLGLWARLVFNACDVVLCQSQAARVGVLASFGRASRTAIDVVPNWVDAKLYDTAIRRSRDSGFRFLFMGWVQRTKGVFEIIDAVRQLRDAGRVFTVDICGQGPALGELMQKAQEAGLNGVLTFQGWVRGDEKIEALHLSHALLLPSYTEGMPNCVLEAMAASRAVIASRVGGVPELVDDGKTGILIPKGDAVSLAAAMARLMDDPGLAERMGQEGLRRVLLRHDIGEVWPRVATALGLVP